MAKKLPRAIVILALVAVGALRAGDFKEPASRSGASPWNAELSSGWDSLYMFRGVNQLPGFDGYGSSISWTALSVSIDLTSADTLTLASWAAFGLSESGYKEIDAAASWAHTFGALSVSAGYALYAVLDETYGLYAHELNAMAAYDVQLGSVVLSPSISYAINLGPAPGNRGYVEQASSYLELRVDGSAPVWRDVVSVAPWAALGINFRYNTTTDRGEPSPFVGADHVEAGVAVPFALGGPVTIAPYVAASFQWSGFPGTRAATPWAGIAASFSF